MKKQSLQLLLCKYDVPLRLENLYLIYSSCQHHMQLWIFRSANNGRGGNVNHKGSGMASFGQGTAVHYTDPVYDIQISVIHFLPFIRGVLGVLADGGQKIVFFAVDGFDTAEIALPYAVQRLVFAIVISGFQGQYRNILIVISQFISTIFGFGCFITARDISSAPE